MYCAVLYFIRDEIRSGSIILWSPIDTCQQKTNTSCRKCVESLVGTCYWCSGLNMV